MAEFIRNSFLGAACWTKRHLNRQIPFTAFDRFGCEDMLWNCTKLEIQPDQGLLIQLCQLIGSNSLSENEMDKIDLAVRHKNAKITLSSYIATMCEM